MTTITTRTRKLRNGYTFKVDAATCVHCGDRISREHRNISGSPEWTPSWHHHLGANAGMMQCKMGRLGTRAEPK